MREVVPKTNAGSPSRWVCERASTVHEKGLSEPVRCDACERKNARCANTTDCRAAHCSKAYSTATTQASCPLLARPCARRLSRSLKNPSHAGHIDVEESSEVVVVVEYLRWARA